MRWSWLSLLALCAADRPTASRAVFTDVETTPSCWYFTGPGSVGRFRQLGPAATLQVDGVAAVVELGGARFEGTLTNGLITRQHWPFDAGWDTTETLRGTLRDGGFCGTYTYEECDRGQPKCPGRCRITARVAIGVPLDVCAPASGAEVSARSRR